MKYFKELLLLSNIKRMSHIKINNDYVPSIPKIKDFNSYLEKEYSKEDINKALSLTEKVYELIEDNQLLNAVTIFDKEYPDNLKDLGAKAPPFLYVIGNYKILSKPNVGVIGTRKPGLDTQNFEYKFVHNLIMEFERVIVSGFALGCDKIAHTAAVDIGEPTIAVMPSGINKITPERNVGLAKLIINNEGCLISGFKPNACVNQSNYSIRNQYVASLSDGIFVGQCSTESGTMETVDYARKLHRKVGCFIPEDCGNDDFSGSKLILNKYRHQSIRIDNADDVSKFIQFLEAKPKKRDYQSTLLDFILFIS